MITTKISNAKEQTYSLLRSVSEKLIDKNSGENLNAGVKTEESEVVQVKSPDAYQIRFP